MEWQFKWGDKIEFLQSIVDETGEQPLALQEQVELASDLEWYMEHFWRLSRDRPHTQGYPLYLTTHIIEFYRRVFQIADRDDFHRYIHMIDDIYLTEVAKKREAESKKTT